MLFVVVLQEKLKARCAEFEKVVVVKCDKRETVRDECGWVRLTVVSVSCQYNTWGYVYL